MDPEAAFTDHLCELAGWYEKQAQPLEETIKRIDGWKAQGVEAKWLELRRDWLDSTARRFRSEADACRQEAGRRGRVC
jgi:hypothetical protein